MILGLDSATFSVLVVLVLVLVYGGWRLFRSVSPSTRAGVALVQRDSSDAVEELEGFQLRIVEWIGTFMRRVAVSLIVLAGLLLLSLAVNVLLVGEQRQDNRQRGEQTKTNEAVIKRFERESVDRRRRAAATDRQQCQDIERLKANARKGAREGRRTIRALKGLPKEDVEALLESARQSEKRFAPRVVRTKNGELVGLAACTALPNADP